jgi:hypothetical protein
MLSSVLDLAKFYDSFDVENEWQQNRYISWKSGREIKEKNENNSYKTHCSAFVSAVSSRLGIPLLRPPQVSTEGLANKQFDWLENNGIDNLWIKLKSPLDAQETANCGYFVIAVYKNHNNSNGGHIAIVRPYQSEQNINKHVSHYGPRICQAGFINSSSIDAIQVFENISDYVFWAHKCQYTVI